MEMTGFQKQLLFYILGIAWLPLCVHAQKDSLFIKGFYGDEKYPVDTVEITSSFELPPLSPGYYSCHLSSGDSGIFTIGSSTSPSAAPPVKILDGKLMFTDSEEARALELFQQYKERYKLTTDSIRAADRKMDEFDPQYETRSLQMRNALVDAYAAYNERLSGIQQNYPETYTATVLVPLALVPLPDEKQQAQFDNLISFNHYHFFMHVPLTNEVIISNPFFEEKLKTYISLYTHHGNDEMLKKDLVYMIDSLSTNMAVKEFIRYVMMKHYVKNGPGKMVDFLAELNAGVCESSVPFQQNTVLKNILAMQPGRPAPQLAIRDFDGSMRSLSGVMSGKKAGIVVFWASWCGHCADTIPTLYQWYKTQRNNGLEVYAVSLDDDKYQWHTFTETYCPDWVNVRDLKGWDSESVITYKVRATPTYVAIDDEGKVILKTNSIQELKKSLAPVLSK